MRIFTAACIILSVFATAAWAQDDALGLYFNETEFTQETANRTTAPGFTMPGYVVLTNATGPMIAGYEVGIAGTAADFAIPLTSLFIDFNAGTNSNHIVTFASPKPVAAGGTVMSTIFFVTDSTELEEISFGPSIPSSLPGVPVVEYVSGGAVACSQPFGTPTVAWLNAEVVAVQTEAWGGVKALYR
jgi:hypothetical protein